MQKLKLLIITAVCDGTDVGEAWSSFQWVSRLAERHDVTLLTYRKHDKPTATSQLPGVRVIEWPDLPLVGKWERFNSMVQPGYVAFYLRVRSWIKKRIQRGESFDLVHQISPLALRYPSPAARLGVPLVIGPLGGSLETPDTFSSEFGSSPWFTRLREFDRWRLRHDVLLRSSYASANLLIGVAPYVKDLLGDLASNGFELISETGVKELPPSRSRRPKETEPLRLLFVGRVVRSKGLRDSIRALAQVKEIGSVRFDVVGDGDDLALCRREAQELGLAGIVAFHGRLPRNEVDSFYANADVFVFPSFREPSGNAVIEAMSHGLAMIVADRGGPGFVVDDACGFRIPVTNPEDFAHRIATAISQLVGTPDLIATMGASSREKIKSEFLWGAKVERLTAIYDRVLATISKVPQQLPAA